MQNLAHTQKVTDLYKAWAPLYDESVSIGIPYKVEEGVLIDIVNPKPGERILDVGCGTGRTIEKLISSGAEITGIDLSEEMLGIAKKKFPRISFINANIEDPLPFPDGSFHKIISSLTFQFIADIREPLGELYRVLKPRGMLVVTDFLAGAPLDWSLIEYNREKKFKGSVGSVSTFRTLVEYVELLTHPGFEIVGLVPLRIRENCKEVLTETSWNKVHGNWASVLFALRKPAV